MLVALGCGVPELNAATFFSFTSSPSSWIGQGQTLTFTNVSGSGAVSFGAGGYGVTFVGPNFSAPQVGFYPNATRYPFNGSGVGMAFTVPGRANNTLTGYFNVLEAVYTNGQPAAFAVDFVQYDEGNLTWWNRGSIRYNSDIPSPGPQAPIRLTNFSITNGVAQFILTGPQDIQCTVQRSSNNVNWASLGSYTISPVGMVAVSDGTATDPARFYRATSSAGGGGGSNDQFANRFQIVSGGGTVSGSNVGATMESGEPNHGNAVGGKSVWWTWTAPSTGIANIGTDGSSFDTLLGVYTGTDVASLTPVFEDDDAGSGACSRAVFNVTAGTTYQIAVDGFNGVSGSIQLTVKMGVPNDAFANPLQLTGNYDQYVAHNINATAEAGEPYHWPNTGWTSVWWTWVAPASGVVTFSTDGSNFDTILAAYTGSTVSGLTLMANNDDYVGSTSQISFYATAGVTYRIVVDGYEGWMGGILLTMQQ